MKRMLYKTIVFAVALATAFPTSLAASPLRATDVLNQLLPGDDTSSTAVTLGFDININGVTYDEIFVNTNGNVTFEAGYSGFPPDPQDASTDLASPGIPIIAPFFADVDTAISIFLPPEVQMNPGAVGFGPGLVGGRPSFQVLWNDVRQFVQFNSQEYKRNTFQLVLIERADTGAGNFDVEFNYGNIAWEAGDISGGVNGLGGNAARVGFADGRGILFELPGSGIAGSFLNGGTSALVTNSNVGIQGRYRFEVRDGQNATSVIPNPPALMLMMAGLAAFGVLGRTRRRVGPR